MKLIQQQIDTANTKARLAEHRAENNEKLLNQKMVEMSKIQGTLTQQTKVRSCYKQKLVSNLDYALKLLV